MKMEEDEEKAQRDENEDEDDIYNYIPIDKGWAWMVVAGSFGVCVLVPGSIKSFGVLLVELSRKFDAPASALTFAQSIAGFFHLAIGPIANGLSKRFSYRIVVIFGGILAGIGLIATSYATSVTSVYLTYGLLTGIGTGFSFSPAITLQGLHFRERRALANGISASGVGAGCFALPNLIRYLLDEYSLSGCMLILGGIMLNTCMFACLFRPHDFWKPKKNHKNDYKIVKTKTDEENNSLYTSIHNGKINGHLDYDPHPLCTTSMPCLRSGGQSGKDHKQLEKADSLLLRSDAKTSKTIDKGKQFMFLSIESLQSVSESQIIRTDLVPQNEANKTTAKQTSYIQWFLLKNPVFLIMCFAMCMGNLSQHLVFNVLPSVADELGHSDESGAFLVSIVGISDLIGRISSGWFSDLKFFERKTIFQFYIGIFGLLCFVYPHVSSFIGLCVLSAVSGMVSGSFIGIQVAVFADTLGVQYLASAFGFALFFTAFGLLLNPFLAGVIRDTTGSWIGAYYISAIACSLGFLALVLEIVFKIGKTKDNETTTKLQEQSELEKDAGFIQNS